MADTKKKPVNRLTRGRRAPVKAMAVPRPGDLRNAAISLSRGRLANGSLLSTIVNAMARAGGQGLTRSAAQRAAGARGNFTNPLRTNIPRSAAPITPGMKVSAEVARNVSAGDGVKDPPRQPSSKSRVTLPRPSPMPRPGPGPSPSPRQVFKPRVRLDPSQVVDRRGDPPVRTGISASTVQRGPTRAKNPVHRTGISPR